MRRERGMSFIEILIASAILMGVALLAMLWLTGSWSLWETATTQSELRHRAQQILGRIAADLRDATRTGTGSPPNVAIPAAPDNTTLTFFLPTDLDGNGLITDVGGNTEWDVANPVQFLYVPAQRQLQRLAAGAAQVMASDVSAVAFTDRTIDPQLNLDEVRVTLTLERTTAQQRLVSATAVATVKLRN